MEQDNMVVPDDIYQLAYKQVYDNTPRNIAFDAYMQMYKSGWDLPPEVRQLPWIMKVINSDPYDAIQTGVRIISTLPPTIKFQPLSSGPEAEEYAGEVEKVCKWQLKSANRRRSRSVEYEVGRQALLYDMSAVRTIDLQYEIQERKMIGANTKRAEEALSKGRFMVVPYDARNVHPIWSDVGLEAVLVVQHRRAQAVIDEWGGKALQHQGLVNVAKEPHEGDWVTYYDYTSFDRRVVWCDQGRTFTVPARGVKAQWVIDDGKNPLPFLNWSIKGGSELEWDGMHKFQPLLYPIYATGAWDIKNIVQTLGVSEVIAHTGSPKFVEEGPNSTQSDVNYMTPERIAKMSQGNTLRSLPAPSLDNALQNVEAMLSSQIDKATVARILQGGELPAGVAYASLNLITQTAIGVLTPAKDLAQKVLAGIFENMLEWSMFTGEPLYGYETKGEEAGRELVIEPKYLDPAGIYIDVVLTPDSPTDKAQKVNTAGIMVSQLGLSQATALEEVGYENPQEELKRGIYERLMSHELELELERERLALANEMQLEMIEKQNEVEMEVQKEMMAEQRQQEQPPPQETGAGGLMPPMGDMPPMGGEQMFGEAGPTGAPTGQGFGPEGLPAGMFAPQANAEGAGGAEPVEGLGGF
jgi:hypothetical protein